MADQADGYRMNDRIARRNFPTTRNRSPALEIVQSLPPDGLTKVAELINDVVRAHDSLAEKHEGSIRDMNHLSETPGHRERVLATLTQILLSAELNDEARVHLVSRICELGQ
jgi:hypothetical protein